MLHEGSDAATGGVAVPSIVTSSLWSRIPNAVLQWPVDIYGQANQTWVWRPLNVSSMDPVLALQMVYAQNVEIALFAVGVVGLVVLWSTLCSIAWALRRGEISSEDGSDSVVGSVSTLSQSHPSKRRRAGVPMYVSSDGITYLCPALVVPKNRQCLLGVPRLSSASNLKAGSSYSIHDANAVPVITALMTSGGIFPSPRKPERRGDREVESPPSTAPGSAREAPRLVLSSTDDHTVLAFCQVCEETPRSRIIMHSGGGTPCGSVFFRDAGYVFQCDGLSGEGGPNVFYNMDPRSSTATDRQGNLLAIVEPRLGNDGAMYQSVIVGPLVDAGFLVAFVMAIDWLEVLKHIP